MFLSHFAVGLAAKRAAPGVSLGTLFLAGQFADLLWPTLVLAGLERVDVRPGITALTPLDFVSYPYSHSLLLLALWGALFGVVYVVAARSRAVVGALLAVLVVSHWPLDWIAHRPDLPLTPGGAARLGLGLWNSVPGTLLVESLLFAAGVWLYVGATSARDRAGSAGFAALAAFLVLVYAASVFGPPPPGAAVVAWSAQAMWLIVIWAYWVDGRRGVRALA